MTFSRTRHPQPSGAQAKRRDAASAPSAPAPSSTNASPAQPRPNLHDTLMPWGSARGTATLEPPQPLDAPACRPAYSYSRWLLSLLAPAVLLLTACGGDSSALPSTQDAGVIVTPVAGTNTPEARSPTVTASSPTPAASATPVPPAPVPPAASGISFDPPQLPQGGTAVVYLNETAVNATLTFGGRQYPMIQAGNRWWAAIGVGAFTQPGLAPVTIAYTRSAGAAVSSLTQSIAIVDHEYPVSQITLDPGTASLLAPDIVNNEIAQRAAIFSGYTAQKLWNGPFQRPAEGPLSDRYGEGRSYNGAPVTDYHKGTDFVGNIGDPVYAAAAGRVVFTGELKVRGNTVIIDHGLGVFSAYHHLSAIKVAQGATVVPGQRIGDIGSTGLVTGPHMHWEVIVRGVEVDGEEWLTGMTIGP